MIPFRKYEVGGDAVGERYEPPQSRKIPGDGNCYFRSLSFFVTGTQHNHLLFRRLLCQYIDENKECFMNLHEPEFKPNYKEWQIKMKREHTWADEIIVKATSCWLNLSVWTYSPAEWLVHNHDQPLVNIPANHCKKPGCRLTGKEVTKYHWIETTPYNFGQELEFISEFSKQSRGIYMKNVSDHYEPVLSISSVG